MVEEKNTALAVEESTENNFEIEIEEMEQVASPGVIVGD